MQPSGSNVSRDDMLTIYVLCNIRHDGIKMKTISIVNYLHP